MSVYVREEVLDKYRQVLTKTFVNRTNIAIHLVVNSKVGGAVCTAVGGAVGGTVGAAVGGAVGAVSVYSLRGSHISRELWEML